MHVSTGLSLITAVSRLTAVSAQQNCDRNKNFPIVPHDSLKYIPETIKPGNAGDKFRRYEPYLHIASGCRSYPAVNQAGQVSGGLQASGGTSSGCNDGSNQQTYVRGKALDGRYFIMYAWFFPKDQTTSGGVNGGHRYDWENVVVILDDVNKANPVVIGTAASGHGNYKKNRGLPQTRDGTRLQVEYFSTFPYNHELQFKTSPGVDLAMIDWDSLSQLARDALNKFDFGSANVPFSDCNFDNNLRKANA